MATMTMTTPLGRKVQTRANRRYAVVTDYVYPDGTTRERGVCVRRTDEIQTAVGYVRLNKTRGTWSQPQFFIYDTVLRTRVGQG